VNNVPLVWRTSVHYLGLIITSNLCWTNHCKIISAKATRCLNFLRHTLWSATPFVKSIAYRCVVRPLLEYGCQLWNPFTTRNIRLLEQIQRRAAHWVCSSGWDPFVSTWTKSSDQCLDELGWPSLKSRCDYLSVGLLYDIIHNKVAINLNNFCSFVSSCTRRLLFHYRLPSSHSTFLFFGNTPFKIPFNILSSSNRDAFHRAVKNYFFGTM